MNQSTQQNLNISVEMERIMKISRRQQKGGTPKRHIITVVFEEKSMMTLQDKNQALQECL